MKESELFDENKVSLVKTVRKIQGKGQKFDVSGVLYAKKLKAYVFPRKYDAEKKIYTCRQKNAQEDCEIAESELSRHINVTIRIQNTDMLEKDVPELAKLKICLTDKLDKVVVNASSTGGQLFCNGKAIDDLEETVEHFGIHEGQQLILLSSGM